MILPFLAVKGTLRPISPEGEAFVLSKERQVVKAEFLTPKQIHSRAQECYWHGVMVPCILACWKAEKEWSVTPNHDTVHGRLVAAVFGMIDTPLGPERMSSTKLTIEQYTQLIEAGKEHLWDRYQVRAPEPSE
jgi:hypothetical protein